MPQISVIVPVYNVEPYLRRCVDSILAQTFTDFELILVDDGSPDGCPAICDEYAEKDSRVHVIHQQNGGLSAARNAGIDWAFANSDSQWISFVDSDDWIHPKSLEALMNGAKETGLDVVIGGFDCTEGKNPDVDVRQLTAAKWNTETYFCEHNVNAVVAWGKLYRKECFREIRYPVGKIHEDEFTTYKILFEYQEIAVIDQPLYAYFQNEKGITKSEWNSNHLVLVDALEERCFYFKENNKNSLYRTSVKQLLDILSWNVVLIENSNLSDEEKKDYLKLVRRIFVKKIAKYWGAFSIKDNEDVFMRVGSHFAGVISRLNRLERLFCHKSV